MKDYHINVYYSAEDKCYIADIPDLKHCSAAGATPEEAVREVQLAKAAWIAVARERKKPVPKPKYRLAIYRLSRRHQGLQEFRLRDVHGGRQRDRRPHSAPPRRFDPILPALFLRLQ